MATTFPMEHQEETDWCWDAVAVSIEHYFDPYSKLTQPGLARTVLGAVENQPAAVDQALESIQKLSRTAERLSFAEIQEQLDQGLPVCVRIVWDEGGAHAVVITGYDTTGGARKLYVSDPILKDSNVMTWDYDSFLFAYDPAYAKEVNAEGAWDLTYLVQP